MMTPAETVRQFLERINQRDPDKLAELMSDGHAFIDSLGNTVRGKGKMRTAWRGHYAMCPDYWVQCEHIMQGANRVAAFGAAGGTIDGTICRKTGARLAVIEIRLVKEWRVYADNKPVYDILAKRS